MRPFAYCMLAAVVACLESVASAAPTIKGMYVGPPGYANSMPAVQHCGTAPESWVRGNVALSQAGVLHVDAELETDDTSAGPKGRIDLVLYDVKGAVLGNVQSSVVERRGRYPGKAKDQRQTFGATVDIGVDIANRVGVIEIRAECVGIRYQGWWDSTPVPNTFTLDVTLHHEPSVLWIVAKDGLYGVGGHFVLWLLLLLTVYPRSEKFRRVVIFTPFWRNVLGAFYTQLLIVMFAPLRRWLFRPLTLTAQQKDPLDFDESSFYPKLRISRIHTAENLQLPPRRKPPVSWDVLYGIDGLVELRGASGLGKTSILKALAHQAQLEGRTYLFLRASDCKNGVINRILADLDFKESSAFVERMLEDGAIDLFIDALNEASPDTITKIEDFCKESGRRGGRIVVTTQPNTWKCPPHAAQFEVQELDMAELGKFLESQWSIVARPGLTEETYRGEVNQFVAALVDRVRDREVLRNPMDLALVAMLLARDQRPNVHGLRDQVFGEVAVEYERDTQGARFPFGPLAAVATAVLDGYPFLDTAAVKIDRRALELLAERKLVIKRGENYMFRHVTITVYLVARQVHTHVPSELLTAERCKILQFHDVYRRLAESISLEAADEMVATLRDRGRENGDRTLDTEIQDIIDQRRAANSSLATVPAAAETIDES